MYIGNGFLLNLVGMAFLGQKIDLGRFNFRNISSFYPFFQEELKNKVQNMALPDIYRRVYRLFCY